MIALTGGLWLRRTGLLALVFLLAGAVAVLVGPEWVSPARLFSGEPEATFIVEQIRVPRVLTGLFVGGALAACGAAFQALLRNPLASPFILGVSGGGSLGAVLAIVSGISVAGLAVQPLFAFLGCLGALLLIYAVARRSGRLVPQALLLTGVVANTFFLSALGFLHYLATPHQSAEILRWMMGGLSGQTATSAAMTGVLAVAGVAVLTLLGRDLNVLSLGEETAAQLGVPVGRIRRRVFVLASLMTGAAVAVSGPIGFVGLFIPHGVRILFGADHRLLLPLSFLAGGAFLVLADAGARVAAAPSEMPVGLVTAAVGAPAFVALLVRGRGLGGRVDR